MKEMPNLFRFGKEILIKAVATAIPTYAMMCFRLPLSLCHRIHQLVRQFWWGQKTHERKLAWISWQKMSHQKWEGGLGFKDIAVFNQALLAKQFWRIMNNPTCLLYKLYQGRYFPNSTILHGQLRGRPSW
ncbi:uncharacterized mitochondrial protein AtMg00310-like [Mercurialis annua]|uniref:uncharacterized mitochondrial protein AtMg00310-like n=1 Tax=Mercurialis annua TaxID=3986 RepID=UPI00215EDC02|nr:uncharacterized mitochondrial protein AtMg00310-like [Mercurialis annua]